MAQSRIGQWSSRWLFILAATGSAVGLGNIWKFPYITGENGGGIFVLMYLGLILLIGIPVLMAEIMLGRRGGQSPVKSLEVVATESGRPKAWGWLGFAGILTAFFLLSIYSVIAGWSASYVFRAFSGTFNGLDAQQISFMYDSFLANPKQLMIWHTVFMGITALVVSRGLQNGVETAIQILVPGLFIILLILVAYSVTTPGFKEGFVFLFYPDFKEITASSFLLALGQAFFTLSIATASMLIYGAYLAKTASIAKAAGSIALLDTLSALLAGLAIFPIVYTYGLVPDEGVGLVFKTLPLAFGEMPYGQIFGGLFFLLLLFAALGSSISMVEPIVAWVTQRWKMARAFATWLVSGSIWLVGVGSVLSFNVWKDYRLFGRWNYYELLDDFVFMLLLPLGGLLIAVFAGWFMRRQFSFAELEIPEPLYNIWRFSIRYLAPLAVLVLVVVSLK
jgi:NSS family neurotransmitter:Na+ symporter